jgi:hypothetical protein
VTIRLELATLTIGIPVMHHIRGNLVRAAYDPQQIQESAVLAWLCTRIPQLVRDGFRVLHVTA